MKCCCLVCWKLGLKGQNYSTQSNLIQSGLKGHSYHFLHPSHLFNINMYDICTTSIITKECRTHICHKYHKLYVEKFWEILPQFTRFHVENIEPKKNICGEKTTNMRSERVLIVIMTWAGIGLAGTGLVMFKPSTALRQASSEQPDPESSLKAKAVMFSNCICNALMFHISSSFLQVFIKRLYPYFFHSL